MEKLEIKRFACDLTAVLGSILQHVLTVLPISRLIVAKTLFLVIKLAVNLVVGFWLLLGTLCKVTVFMNLACIGYLFLNFRVNSISVHLPR